MSNKELFNRMNAEGRRYCTKGEYRKALKEEYIEVPDLEEGETWDDWFETYFQSLLETGEAKKVGNHYEVYDS